MQPCIIAVPANRLAEETNLARAFAANPWFELIPYSPLTSVINSCSAFLASPNNMRVLGW